MNELAIVRLARPRDPLWPALRALAQAGTKDLGPGAAALPEARWEATREKVARLLDRLERWRGWSRQLPLSDCLDRILTETRYEDWLRIQPRGEQRCANVRRFVDLARQFDPWQRQGLLRFLRFVEARLAAEADPPPAVVEAHCTNGLSTQQGVPWL